MGILLLLFSACQFGEPQTPHVVISNVTFTGNLISGGQSESYLGIPFAAAPIDKLRWALPQEWIPQETSYTANQFAPACMQGPHLSNWYKNVISSFGSEPDKFITPEISEDCLYLNVWRPTKKTLDLLPVIVYIHGGSNKGGWSYEPNYEGTKLASKGVIVVSIAYRVGVFGFFSHPQLEQANFGLLDQIAALQWIQNNIHVFGGDRNAVTVMGESAGANNIDYLLVSPLSRDLFARVIHQSGGSSLTNRSIRTEHLRRGQQFSSLLLEASPNDAIDQLREFSSEDILAAAQIAYVGHYFDPVVDNFSVLKTVVDSVREGKIHPVDLLIGTNHDEWLLDLEDGVDVEAWLAAEVSNEVAQQLRSVLGDIANPKRQMDLLITAKHYVCPSLMLATKVKENQGQSWVYSFNRVRPGALAASMGAYHGAELPYVFDTHDEWLPTDAVDRRLTETIQSYWTQFVKTGNPNYEKLPAWLPYKTHTASVQMLDNNISQAYHSSQSICDALMPL